MKIIVLVVFFGVIAAIDIPSIVRKASGKAKYFAAHGLILIAGFTISLLQIIEKAPESPAKIIQSIVKGFTGDM